MFIGDQVLLDISYDQALRRLAALAGSEVLVQACETAYGDGLASLAGSAGPAGAARLAGLLAGKLAADGSWACLPMRWEAIGLDGGLFPALDADLTLTPAGEQTTVLAIAAAYRPPSPAGAVLNRALVSAAAAATIRSFLARTACALARPAVAAVPRTAQERA